MSDTYIRKHGPESLSPGAGYTVLPWPAPSLPQLHWPHQTRGEGCELQNLLPITQLQLRVLNKFI